VDAYVRESRPKSYCTPFTRCDSIRPAKSSLFTSQPNFANDTHLRAEGLREGSQAQKMLEIGLTMEGVSDMNGEN
jgi:hypothetical protein